MDILKEKLKDLKENPKENPKEKLKENIENPKEANQTSISFYLYKFRIMYSLRYNSTSFWGS